VVKGSQGKTSSRGKAKPKAKGKPGPKRRSNRDATQKARERAAGLVPNPNFKVIASDPLKAQIVAVALQRPYSPSEYAREAGVDLRIASYAFKVLREKGVLELVKEEKVRGATLKHMYRATEAALVSNTDWGDLSEALRPVFTGTILQDFSARVTHAIETGHLFSRDDFCLYWAPADLDEIAWKEQVEIYNWCIEASKQLVVETTNRRADGESEGSFHATFAIAAFPSPTHDEIKKHAAKGKRKDRGKGKAKRSRAKSEGVGGPKRGNSAKGKNQGTTKRKGREA
jgi:DNA-binding transcriptional ArsR family regulator